MPAKIRKKGIYCIEGLWDHGNIQDQSTVLPILDLLETTGAIATIGYKRDIDWIQSTACDLFVFEALQSDSLDTKGIKNMHKKIITDYGNLHKILELRVVINEKKHFSRQRK